MKETQGKPLNLHDLAMELRKEMDASRPPPPPAFVDIDALPNLVWTADCAGKLLHTNSRSEDLGDMSCGWECLVHPDDRHDVIAAWARSVKNGDDYDVMARWRLADGSYCWYLCRARPCLNALGHVTGWAGANVKLSACTPLKLTKAA